MYLSGLAKPSRSGLIVKLGRGKYKDTSGLEHPVINENTSLSADHNGRSNRSFSFIGDISSDIAFIDNADLRLTAEASWFFYCKNEIPDIAFMFKHGSAGDRGWIIHGDTGKMRIALTENGTTFTLHYTTNQAVFDNTWHLYGITFNNGVLKLFMDGEEITDITKTEDTGMTSIYPSVATLRIGRYNKCLISAIDIASKAIVLSTIKKNYNYLRSH